MPTLLGRYELVRKLATGGMAEIFLARQWGDAGFCRPSIVKRLHDHLAEEPLVLSDFCNEARLLSLLSHPSVPHVYDFRHEQGCWYIAMELLRGPTLGDAMRRAAGPVPWDVVVSVGLELLDALGYIHERRDEVTDAPLAIVHGDLSPDNVVLGRDGGVKLLDFGLAGDRAHRAQRATLARGLRGTNGYMAPEAVDRRQPVDGRADLFVAGVLLYELMTGTRLYPGDGVTFVNALLERRPSPPSDRAGAIPPDLDRLVLRLLAWEPDERPASAREALAELSAVATAHGLATGPSVVAGFARQVAPPEEDLRLEPAPLPAGLTAREAPSLSPVAASDPRDAGTLTDEEHHDLVSDIEDLFSPAALDDAAAAHRSGSPATAPLPTPGDEDGDGFYIYVADD